MVMGTAVYGLDTQLRHGISHDLCAVLHSTPTQKPTSVVAPQIVSIVAAEVALRCYLCTVLHLLADLGLHSSGVSGGFTAQHPHHVAQLHLGLGGLQQALPNQVLQYNRPLRLGEGGALRLGRATWEGEPLRLGRRSPWTEKGDSGGGANIVRTTIA